MSMMMVLVVPRHSGAKQSTGCPDACGRTRATLLIVMFLKLDVFLFYSMPSDAGNGPLEPSPRTPPRSFEIPTVAYGIQTTSKPSTLTYRTVGYKAHHHRTNSKDVPVLSVVTVQLVGRHQTTAVSKVAVQASL